MEMAPDEYYRRVERAFGSVTPTELLGRQKAIIGSRTDQLSEDAENARQLLLKKITPPDHQLEALERAIRLQRPSILCHPTQRPGPLDSGNPLAPVWDRQRGWLLQWQRSVGRIDLIRPARSRLEKVQREAVGTGFLVGKGLLLTAGHVAKLIQHQEGPIATDSARVEFCGYSESTDRCECAIREVVELPGDLDLGLLRIEPIDGATLADPFVVPRASSLTGGTPVAVMGYPLWDPRNSEGFMRIVFGEGFGVKRVAAGEVLTIGERSLSHDCSTLGGNSGSPMLNLETGQLCGIHVAGDFLSRNFAIPAHLVGNCLEDALAGRVRRTKPAPVPDVPKYVGTPKPSPVPAAPVGVSVTVNSGVIEATIPIQIRIELGNVTLGGIPGAGSAGPGSPSIG